MSQEASILDVHLCSIALGVSRRGAEVEVFNFKREDVGLRLQPSKVKSARGEVGCEQSFKHSFITPDMSFDNVLCDACQLIPGFS